jgi:hypothetical protein
MPVTRQSGLIDWDQNLIRLGMLGMNGLSVRNVESRTGDQGLACFTSEEQPTLNGMAFLGRNSERESLGRQPLTFKGE